MAEQTVNWLVETRQSVRAVIGPFALVNGYGLFRTMTKSRPELQIEGSLDGQSWKLYGFKYKPSKATDSLSYAGFHMPRLDWQMWFAALYPRCSQQWFFGFLESLVDGSKATLELLEHNPFPNTPPRYVRVRRADTRFTTPDEKNQSNNDGRLRRCEIIAQ